MKTNLERNCILITGANGGIGLATARAFAEEGAKLILHYHRGRDKIDEMLKEWDEQRNTVHTLVRQADLRDASQVDAMFAQASRVFSVIDTVIVNAGVWDPTPTPLHQMSLEQWNHTLTSNLTSAFLTCRGFMQHVSGTQPTTASIVLVASTAAVFGEAEHADYAASKAGMAYGLTLSLKNEMARLAPRGRVNCVCPGWTDTPMAAGQIADAELVRRATATRPIRTIAKPEDVAAAIVFLSSESLAGHISGAILTIAGGMEGRLLHP